MEIYSELADAKLCIEGNILEPKHQDVVILAINRHVEYDAFHFLPLFRMHYMPDDVSVIIFTDSIDIDHYVIKEVKRLLADYDVNFVYREVVDTYGYIRMGVKYGVYSIDRFLDRQFRCVFLDLDIWVRANIFDYLDEYNVVVSFIGIVEEQVYPKYMNDIWNNLGSDGIYADVFSHGTPALPTAVAEKMGLRFPLINTGVMVFDNETMCALETNLEVLKPFWSNIDSNLFPYAEQMVVNLALTLMPEAICIMDPKLNWQLNNPYNEVFYDSDSNQLSTRTGDVPFNVHFNGRLGLRRKKTLDATYARLIRK